MSELAYDYDESTMHILDIVDVDNMVVELDKETLDRIGAATILEFDVDKASMKDWLERNELALKLTDLKAEPTNDPWPRAAATKLPLVLNAAMKASAEEFAEIMRGKEIVKCEMLGKHSPEKMERCDRVATRMNFQLYHELDEWQEDHDKLIMSKNIVGTVHKKLFYSDGKIQCVLRRNGVVINDNIEKLQDAPRVTDEIEKFWWQVQEKVNAGEWEEITLSSENKNDFAQADKTNDFLEQIRREDLDGDGYPEPYIVTVHRQTKQVVRITPNYTPESITFKDIDGEEFDYLEYAALNDKDKKAIQGKVEVIRIDGSKARLKYVKYEMIPSWEGGYWGFGYGILLGPLNENCNTLVNQLLNAGHLATKGGGFINSGIKMGGGELKFRANEWKKVQSPGMDLSRNIVPLPVKEPSQTLFSLLGLLMDVLKELSSVTEVMSGEQPKANMPYSSIAALIEQGKKMFNAVYIRHYRSLGKEQVALFDLNFLYQDPKEYIELLDEPLPPGADPLEFTRKDFTKKGMDILPTANPEFSSRIQRMSESQAMMELRDDPRVNGSKVLRLHFENILDDKDRAAELVPDQPNLTPQQAQEQAQQKLQEFLDSNTARESEAKAKLAEINLQKAQAEAQTIEPKMQADLETKAIALEKGKVGLQGDQLSIEKEELELQKKRVETEALAIKETSEVEKKALEVKIERLKVEQAELSVLKEQFEVQKKALDVDKAELDKEAAALGEADEVYDADT